MPRHSDSMKRKFAFDASSGGVANTAAKADVHPNTIKRWIDQYCPDRTSSVQQLAGSVAIDDLVLGESSAHATHENPDINTYECQASGCSEAATHVVHTNSVVVSQCLEHAQDSGKQNRPIATDFDTIDQLAQDGQFGRWAKEWVASHAEEAKEKARQEVASGKQYYNAALGFALLEHVNDDQLYSDTAWAKFERRTRADAANSYARSQHL